MQVCANAVALRQAIGLELGRRIACRLTACWATRLPPVPPSVTLCAWPSRYPALSGTLFELSLEEDGQRVWFTARDYREDPALAAFNIELCLASLNVICDDLLVARSSAGCAF